MKRRCVLVGRVVEKEEDESCRRADPGQAQGDLWWVFGFEGGPVYMGGTGGTILRYAPQDGSFSLRELVIAIFVLVVIVSWIAEQFFNRHMPEFMFYSVVSLIGAGCFGYSLERKAKL